MTTILPFSNSIARKRQRSGISPVIASTILIGITVVLGLALWSFANAGVGTATKEYAEGVTDYGKFTSDKFVIANMDFNNPNNNEVAFWIFNSGRTPTALIDNVVLVDRASCGDWVSGSLVGPLTVDSKALQKFYFVANTVGVTTLDNCNGQTFELTVVSETGATQTFIKKK